MKIFTEIVETKNGDTYFCVDDPANKKISFIKIYKKEHCYLTTIGMPSGQVKIGEHETSELAKENIYKNYKKIAKRAQAEHRYLSKFF